MALIVAERPAGGVRKESKGRGSHLRDSKVPLCRGRLDIECYKAGLGGDLQQEGLQLHVKAEPPPWAWPCMEGKTSRKRLWRGGLGCVCVCAVPTVKCNSVGVEGERQDWRHDICVWHTGVASSEAKQTGGGQGQELCHICHSWGERRSSCSGAAVALGSGPSSRSVSGSRDLSILGHAVPSLPQ